MTWNSYEFSAFTEADMLAAGAGNGNYLRNGETFTMPVSASATLTVTDNDGYLSGDSRYNENANDCWGQQSAIEVDGEEVGNGGQIYAECYYWLRDQDGNWYLLIEIEQERTCDNYFTFCADYGGVPPAGAELTVYCSGNVSCWQPRYDCLGAGDGAPAPNVAPVAVDDAFSTDDEAAVAGSLLANDDPVDGDALMVSAVSFGAVGGAVTVLTDSGNFTGDLTVGADGSFTFTPGAALAALGAGDVETVTFTYTVSDGKGGEDTATATITINGVNDGPEVVDDEIIVPAGEAVGGDIGFISYNILSNDSDLNGDEITLLTVNGQPAGDTITVVSEGGVTVSVFIDAFGEIFFDSGTDFRALAQGETDKISFTYTVEDGNGGIGEGAAHIVIEGRNDGPVAVDDSITINATDILGSAVQGDSIVFNLLANDSDVDGDAITVKSVSGVSFSGGDNFGLQTAAGRLINLSVDENGDVQLDPSVGFSNLPSGFGDSIVFTYEIVDEFGEVDEATATITVLGQGDDDGGPVLGVPVDELFV